MTCPATNLPLPCLPRPGGTALGLAAAALAALGLAGSGAALPAQLEAAMGLPPATYALPDLLALRGAVREEDLGVMAALAASGRDFDALVARATARGHGSLHLAAQAR